MTVLLHRYQRVSGPGRSSLGKVYKRHLTSTSRPRPTTSHAHLEKLLKRNRLYLLAATHIPGWLKKGSGMINTLSRLGRSCLISLTDGDYCVAGLSGWAASR